MTKEEIQKSVEGIVEDLLANQKQEEGEVAEKAMPASMEENGGDDKIKSGTPMTDKQKEEAAKKAKEDEADMEKAKEDEKDEEKEEKSMKKSEDAEEKKEMKEVADKEVKEHEKDMHKKKEMKKSQESEEEVVETIELSEEEMELLKAWRSHKEQEETEEITKSQAPAESEELQKSLAAQEERNEKLEKALNSQSDLIKSLTDKIEKLASQPAYDKKAITSLEPIEKSSQSNGSEELSKAQKADILLDLQKSGKGVRSTHVAQMEATGRIVDPVVNRMLQEEINKRFK